MVDESLKTAFARDVLGPILFAACHRMWLLQTALVGQDTLALFAARGGLRLLDLYERFLRRQNLTAPVECKPFMVSRLSVAKAAFRRASGIVVPNMLREFRNESFETWALALVPSQADESIQEKVRRLPLRVRQGHPDILAFYRAINGGEDFSAAFLQHIDEQERLFNLYLREVAGERRRLLFCDTGLYGGTQLMLMGAWPEYEWYGLYVGRSNYRHEQAPHFTHATGLILEQDRFSARRPETALLRHWHVVEMPLEPDLPSVTHYAQGHGTVATNLHIPGWQRRVTSLDNPYYQGLVEYFDASNTPQSAEYVYVRHNKALRVLQRMICLPQPEDVRALAMGERCPDFGLGRSVPVMCAGAGSLSEKARAIRKSLWREGQIRHEFPRLGGLLNQAVFQSRRLLLGGLLNEAVFKVHRLLRR